MHREGRRRRERKTWAVGRRGVRSMQYVWAVAVTSAMGEGEGKGKGEGREGGARARRPLARMREQSTTATYGTAFAFSVSFALVVCQLSFPSLMGLSKPTLPPQKPGETIKASLPRMDRKEMDTPTLEIIKTWYKTILHRMVSWWRRELVARCG